VKMTSVADEGSGEDLACFRKRMGHAFARAFGFRQRLVSLDRLGVAAAAREPVGTLGT
jgi:hypothetical protein